MAQIQTITSEQENAIKKMVDERVKAKLEEADRRQEKAVDPRNSPNYRRWHGGLGASPFGDTAGGEAPEAAQKSMDYRGVIKEFLGSTEFRNFVDRNERESREFTPSLKSVWGNRRMERALVKGHFGDELIYKAAQLTGVSDARTVLATEYESMIHLKPNVATRVRDLMNVVPVDAGTIKMLREAGFTITNTPMVPENVDPASVTSITNSTLGLTLVTVDIKNIATKVTLPEQYLQDIPQAEQFLEYRLESMGLDVEDSQLLNGDGTGNNILGFYGDSACQSNLWSDGAVGDTQIDAVLNAIILSWLANFEPDAHVMHPQVWGPMVKSKDANKAYLIPQVHQQNAPKVLWGKPVVLTPGAPTGKVLTSSFGASAAIFDRQQPTIYMSRDHGTNRDNNLVTFFLNSRVALGKYRPEATVRTTLDEAPTEP